MTIFRRIARRALGCCCGGAAIGNVDDEEIDYVVVLDEENIRDEQEGEQRRRNLLGDNHEGEEYNHILSKSKLGAGPTSEDLGYVPPKNTLRLISKYEKAATTDQREEVNENETSSGWNWFSPRQQEDQDLKKQSSQRKSFGSPDLQCCDLCHKKIYPFDAIMKSFGKTFHSSCFKCNACGVKMKNEPLEQHLQTQDGLWLACSRCQLRKLQASTPLVIGRVAGSKILVEEEEMGDIDGVMEAIGDELSDLLVQGAMLPTCAVCGTDFIGYTGKVTIIGSLKYHNDCWLMGKPCPFDKCLLPIQATRYMPDRVIVKLLPKDGSTASAISSNTGRRSKASTASPLATMFFRWKTRDEDMKEVYNSALKHKCRNSRLVIFYDLEHNRNNKSSSLNTLRHNPCRAYDIEFAGNPFGESYRPALLASTVTKSDDGLNTIHFKLGVEKYHVLHYVQLSVPMTNDCDLDLTRSYLIVQLERGNEKGRQQQRCSHQKLLPQQQHTHFSVPMPVSQ